MKHQLQTIREALESADEYQAENYHDYEGPRPAIAKALTALSELEAMVGEPVYWQWRRKGHDWTLEYTFANEVQVTTEDSERRALYTAAPPAQQPQEEHLTITWDEHQTRILAVTMQDEDGRILKVLAEAPAQQPNEWKEAVLDWLSNTGKDFPIDTPPSEIVKWLMDYERELANLSLDPVAQQPKAEAVKWGVDWGTHGDRTCVSIIKKHSDGTIEVVANEYEPEANVARKAPQQAEAVPSDWAPTAANINALPAPVRAYIHDMVANADPAGTVRDLSISKQIIRELEASNRMLRDRLAEAVPNDVVRVSVETLNDWKSRVNTLSTLTTKVDRYSFGIKLKQDIADAAQGEKP